MVPTRSAIDEETEPAQERKLAENRGQENHNHVPAPVFLPSNIQGRNKRPLIGRAVSRDPYLATPPRTRS